MLKKTIAYKDYDGKSVSQDFYFHLTQAEIVEIEVSQKDGLIETLKEIIATEDKEQLVVLFKRIILLSYGRRSADGRHFEKDDAITKSFVSSGAYSALFMELITNAASGSEFVNGILPADMPEPDANEVEVRPTTPAMTIVDSNQQTRDLSTMSKDELLAMLTNKGE